MPTKTRSADADKQLELLQRRIADCDDKFAEEKVKCIAAQQKIEACDARIDKIDEKIETSKMDLDSTIRIAFLNADDEICEQDVQDQEDKASDAKDLDASKAQPNMFDASSAQSNYKFVSANASESTVHSNLDSNSTMIESDVDSDATDLNVDASKAQFDMLDASSAQSIELKVVDMNLGFHCAAIVSKLNNTLLISSDHDIAFGYGCETSFGLLSYLEYFENKDLDSFDGASAGYSATLMFDAVSTLELDNHGASAGCGPGNLFGLLSYLEYFEMSGVTSLTVYSDTDVANVESLDNG